jgi:hypothetical protein
LEFVGSIAIKNLGVREPAAPVHKPAFDLWAKRVALHIVLGKNPAEEHANFKEALHFITDHPSKPTPQ